MTRRTRLIAAIATLIATAALCLAQNRGYRGRRQAETHRAGVPEWQNEVAFKKDVFTFVRIKYPSMRGWYGLDKWAIDYRDADLNLSYRLQQLTSLRVDPEGKVLELTDPELFDYPWIYIVEPGDMELADDEVSCLRRYLLNGGFLMVDDFWGEREWMNFYEQIKRVFPEREPVDLSMDHPIFHSVFDIKLEKNQMQVPNVGLGEQSQYNGGITWERYDAREVHFRAIFDDKNRMMVMICHNTDNGDGWEREGESEYYFREFSEKKAYPLGINIIFYAMTH